MSTPSGALCSAYRLLWRTLFAVALATLLFQPLTPRSHASIDKSATGSAPVSDSAIVFGDFDAARGDSRAFLRWNTRFESNVLGFNVRRGSAIDGELVNGELVAGSGTKVANGVLDAGDEYNLIDAKTDFEGAYWVEAVFLSGKREFFGPFFAKPGFGDGAGTVSKTLGETAMGSVPRRPQSESVDFQRNGSKSGTITELADARNQPVVAPAGDPNALKFEVRRPGWYRIPAAVMQSNGFPMSSAGSWKMYVNDRETAITVNSDGSVEFYGEGVDTVQSDTGVYWLTYGGGSGKRITKSTQKFNQSAPNGWTGIVAERRDRVMRLSGVVNGPRENWFAGYVSGTEISSDLNLSEIATESGETATVAVDLQGIAGGPHDVSVVLNGTEIGRIVFSDMQRMEWSANVPLSALRNGRNDLKLRAVASSGDYSLLEAWRISYPRRLTADNDRLQFSVGARKSVKIRGFASPRVRLFDITNPVLVTEINPASRLETDGTYSVTLASASVARLFVAQGEAAAPLAVECWTRNNASDLRNVANRANLLMIAPARFHEDLLPLKNARESGGLTTLVVDPIDIYDEFGGGVRSGEAIRSFLQYARQNWSVKPDFVLLAGNASVDPRNYSGVGGDASNLVPTMFTDTWNIEAVSDVVLADFDGDGLEDISIGRLPVRTNADLAAVVGKILAHDSFSNEQILGRGALMVSDAYLGYNFENGSRVIAGGMPPASNVTFADLASSDPTAFRQNILNTMNAGPAVVSYFGHASVTFWTNQQVYRAPDATGLTNYSQPSLDVMFACLNGTFGETSVESLSEATIKSANGGAFGVWASSGWNSAYDEETLGREFYRLVYSGASIGDSVRRAKALSGTVDLRRTFVYFGDPSQRLVR